MGMGDGDGDGKGRDDVLHNTFACDANDKGCDGVVVVDFLSFFVSRSLFVAPRILSRIFA